MKFLTALTSRVLLVITLMGAIALSCEINILIMVYMLQV